MLGLANRIPLLLILALVGLWCDGCNQPPLHHPSLIVVSGAERVVYSRYISEIIMNYQVNEIYPARGALGEISSKLAKQGWKPMKEDFLNLGTPSSHVRGWTEFADATRTPVEKVRSWGAEWTNAHGDIVSYTLQYRWADAEIRNRDRLLVFAAYTPFEQAKEVRREIDEINKKMRADKAK